MNKSRLKEKPDLNTHKYAKNSTKLQFGVIKRKILLFFLVVVAIVAYLLIHQNGVHELTKTRTQKRDKSIKRAKKREQRKKNCEQYVLLASYSGWYPVLHRGIIVANDSIKLNKGEVWKYGITCNDELKRYPGQVYYFDGKWFLDNTVLVYNIQ